MPDGVQGLDRYAYASNNPIINIDPTGHDDTEHSCYNPDDPGCYDVEVPDGGKYEKVLVGSDPAITPDTSYASYGEEANETYCQDCMDDITGMSQAVSLGADIASGIRNYKYYHDEKEIFIYADTIKYSNGNVSVPSIHAANYANLSITITNIDFNISLQNDPCGGSSCVFSSLTNYSPNPPLIGLSKGGLGIVNGNSFGKTSLLGDPYNPGSSFNSYYKVTITVNVSVFSKTYGAVSNYLPIIYPIK